METDRKILWGKPLLIVLIGLRCKRNELSHTKIHTEIAGSRKWISDKRPLKHILEVNFSVETWALSPECIKKTSFKISLRIYSLSLWKKIQTFYPNHFSFSWFFIMTVLIKVIQLPLFWLCFYQASFHSTQLPRQTFPQVRENIDLRT